MTGGKAAVSEIVGGATAAPDPCAAAAGEQVELFAAPFGGSISVDGRQLTAAQLVERVEARGRGRPKGAQNRTTREWREWWLRAGVDPIGNQLKYLRMTPEELAGVLKCDVVEAFDRQQRIAEFVAPYLFAKQAPTDDQGNVVPVFNVQIGAGAAVDANGQELPPWLAWRAGDSPVIEGEVSPEQNQPLSGSDVAEPKPEEPK